MLCVAPSGVAGAVGVEITNNGASFTSDAVQFQYIPPATLTHIVPVSGSAATRANNEQTAYRVVYAPTQQLIPMSIVTMHTVGYSPPVACLLLGAGLIQLPEGYGGGPSLGNSYRIHGELLAPGCFGGKGYCGGLEP